MKLNLRKVLAIVIALALCVSALPIAALAIYDITDHVLQYDANGGTMPDGGIPSETKPNVEKTPTVGFKVTSLRPTRTNYVFAGWSEDRDAAEATYSAGDWIWTSEEEITLYAVWEAGGHEHAYGEPEWEWTGNDEDGYTAATATFTCTDDDDTQTVEATVTSETTDPTETEDGETVYTATVEFGGETYTDTKTVALPATGESGNGGESGGGESGGSGGGITPAPTPTPSDDGDTDPDEDIDIDEPEDPPLAENPMLFEDVEEKNWYYEAVEYVFNNDLMNGISDTVFSPNGNTTRAQVVTVLYRLEGEPEAELSSFKDVAAKAYYAEAIGWASENGVVKGVSDTEFAPKRNITRQEFVTVLYRYAVEKGIDVSVGETTDLSSFSDAGSVSGYALEAMKWAVGSGLLQGSDGKLNPKGNTTRAQMATILMRFSEDIINK